MKRAEPLVSLVYSSSAQEEFTTGAVQDMAERAQARNKAHGVTGLLLKYGRDFVQVLEGPAPAVDALMARIARDPRHRDVTIHSRDPIAERQFDGWALKVLEAPDQQSFDAKRDDLLP